MTYYEFVKLVAEKGWTLAQLRSDNAAPADELLALMDELGLAAYEKYVRRHQNQLEK